MNILSNVFLKLIEMSIIASFIGIITLIVIKFLKNKIQTKYLHLLWIPFFIVLLCPVRLKSQFSIYNIFFAKNQINIENTNNENNIPDKAIVNNNILDTNEELTNCDNNYSIVYIIAFLYICIFILISTTQALIRKRICKGIHNEILEKRLDSILTNVKNELSIKNKVKIILQDTIKAPAIIGGKINKILLSSNISNYSDEEIKLILIHELEHLKNGDIVLNNLFLLIKNIYFFNPIILLLINEIKEEIEIINDERVIHKILKDEIELYLKTLLKVSVYSMTEYSCVLGISGSARKLEERIKMIKQKDNFITNKIIIFIIISILIFGITVVFATDNIIKNDNESQKTSSTIDFTSPLDEIVISSPFGEKSISGYVHNGVDLVADKGTKVLAVYNGIVENSGFDASKGYYVEIKHDVDGKILYSEYCHLSGYAVKAGDVIYLGEIIGEVGSTGMATGPHLHLAIKNDTEEYLDPINYIK